MLLVSSFNIAFSIVGIQLAIEASMNDIPAQLSNFVTAVADQTVLYCNSDCGQMCRLIQLKAVDSWQSSHLNRVAKIDKGCLLYDDSFPIPLWR